MLQRVMIVSGESSGELYGAYLAKTLKSRNPEIDIIGVGGDRMESSGVELISRISSSFGLIEAVTTYRELLKTFKQITAALKSFNPQVLVLIDFPDFNIRVAKEAKKLGIKILYYVSPQVWAWRRGRVKVIGELVDKMAVVLPFESQIYRDANISCEFTGHPILDEIIEVVQDMGFTVKDIGTTKLKIKIREELGLRPDSPVMALMPGSRRHEVTKLLPVMLNMVEMIKRLYPDYQFVMPIAPNLQEISKREITDLRGMATGILPLDGQSVKSLLAADIGVIASGTSTLQAALLKAPMVVVYRLSPVTYFIGRLVVKVRHISLVNVILDNLGAQYSGFRIKELLQGDANERNIVTEMTKIIDNSRHRDEMMSQINAVRDQFMDKKASLRVAEIAEEL